MAFIKWMKAKKQRKQEKSGVHRLDERQKAEEAVERWRSLSG
ncbi:hypothetical protein [Cytobacillus oceanisediminis]|nr:hypothetical protein [Cytobacillus oceanisediminis]